MTAPPRAEPAVRLTSGWSDSAGPANLAEHHRRHGELRSVRHTGPALVEQVAAAGLTGRGGAGFPTGTKLRAVASRRGPAAVVANGMESEPASEKDQALLARSPHLVLDGMELAAGAVGADVAHLCLPCSRPWLTEIVLAALKERASAGRDTVASEVHELPHSYVASEETSLVHWLNDGDARPLLTPPRPFERGLKRRPTLIDNVETLAHIALIARYGAAWYRSAGQPDMPGTMLVSVTGAVLRPGVFEIAGGTTVGEMLQAAQPAADVSAVLLGGYFGTWHPMTEVSALPFTRPGLEPAGAAPGAGVLFALPAASCGLTEAARILGFLAAQGAQQCGPCMFGLPAIADDLAQLAAARPDGDPLDRIQQRFRQIAGRGACRHPDGAIRMANSALRTFAADVHAHARRRPCRAAPRQDHHAGALSAGRSQASWDLP